MLRLHNTRLLDYLRHRYTAADLERLIAFLRQAGTFHFPALANGLYPAAHVPPDHTSGYASVWIRDNAHVAHAHLVDGRPEEALRTVTGMVDFLATQRPRIAQVLADRSHADDPMNRPHIRFDGHGGAELPERWAHAQNDALGYFLWITAKTFRELDRPLTPAAAEVLAGIALFLEKIEYWQDEDSGHWEETRKQGASSIGAATAGLVALDELLADHSHPATLRFADTVVDRARLQAALHQGRETLATHLPYECVDPDPRKRREADAALLFLVYPLEVLDDETADAVMDLVVRDLHGDIGFRRYRGDSYWCADYKQKIAAEQRSADFSDDLSGRDALLQAGEEAQWCIFDPILSAAYGRRYQRTRHPQHLELQTHYLNRSLAHLTPDDSPFGPLRCPESYYLENGRYVPVDQTPLLWTQGNLLVALRLGQISVSGF